MLRQHARVAFITGGRDGATWYGWEGDDFTLHVHTDVEGAAHVETLHLATAPAPGSPESRLASKLMLLGPDVTVMVEFALDRAQPPRDVLLREDIVSVAAVKAGGIERLIGIPLEWLFQEMVDLSREWATPLQAAETWVHSAEVCRFALEIAGQVSAEGLARATGGAFAGPLSAHVLEKGCFAHDVGRMLSGSAASYQRFPAFVHGFLGAWHLRLRAEEPEYQDVAQQLEVLARICERHTGGSGLVREELESRQSTLQDVEQRVGGAVGALAHPFHVPLADHLAETPYEKIIAYADWRVRTQKTAASDSLHRGSIHLPERMSEETALGRARQRAASPRQQQALDAVREFIHTITGGALDR